MSHLATVAAFALAALGSSLARIYRYDGCPWGGVAHRSTSLNDGMPRSG